MFLPPQKKKINLRRISNILDIGSNRGTFIDHIKKDLGDQETSWTHDWAVAVDESPGKGGEWVNAGFTADMSKTSKDTSGIHYSEWYYVENGKIKTWNQTRRIILNK